MVEKITKKDYENMVEKITKKELERLREVDKKYNSETSTIEVEESEPEPFEVESLATEVQEPETDNYTCSNCQYAKITKDMKKCPSCGSELKW